MIEKVLELRIEYIPLTKAVELLWKKNPKLHDAQILVNSISRHAFRDAPAFDSALDGGAIVDGNGRIEALLWMYEHKKEVPPGIKVDEEGMWYVPIQFGVDSKSQDAAIAYAIDANSTVLSGGDFDGFDMAKLWDTSYVELLNELDELPVTVDAETLAALNSFGLDNEPGLDDSNYSRKIEAPTYTPSGEKPSIDSLFDDSKTRALIDAIDKAEGITDAERQFLRIAAQRHTVLNFKRIADYYAHSDAQMQGLMEDNTLVILDFDRAISQGYVRLTEEIIEMVRDEYGDD